MCKTSKSQEQIDFLVLGLNRSSSTTENEITLKINITFYSILAQFIFSMVGITIPLTFLINNYQEKRPNTITWNDLMVTNLLISIYIETFSPPKSSG